MKYMRRFCETKFYLRPMRSRTRDYNAPLFKMNGEKENENQQSSIRFLQIAQREKAAHMHIAHI